MTKIKTLLPVVLAGFLSCDAIAELAPHRALYDLKGENFDKKSGITAVTGKLAYEIMGNSCEGWSTTYRSAYRIVKTEGAIQVSDTQMTAWESGDGTEMTLNQKEYLNQALSQESSLSAKKSATGEGSVQLTRPADKAFKIPADALFPVAHQKKLLSSAASDQGRDSTTVYEGSDGESVYKAVGLISAKQVMKAKGTPADAQAVMRAMPSWSMTVGYYKYPDEQAELPDYQTSFVMFENGVSTKLLFDYGTYQVAGELVKLDLLPVEPCP
jgi:EipB-like